MTNIKRFISKTLITTVVLTTPVLSFAETTIEDNNVSSKQVISNDIKDSNKDFSSLFNEKGFKKGLEISQRRTAKNGWIDFKAEKNISLDKEWTITFSDEINKEKIDGMVIENNNEFIPVNITLSTDNKATVRPSYLYEADSNYTLKIFLNNGKRYKKSFTTGSDITVTDQKYFEMNNGTIINYTGPSGVVVIPSEVNKQTVKSIGNKAFNNKNISKVIFPETITSIESSPSSSYGAFMGNSLKEISIPNSITSIGDYAFAKNSITKLVLPTSITSIGKSTFQENRISELILPNSITSIGAYAFYKNSLSSLNLPNSVTSIGDSAFKENTLSSINLSTGVKSIGNATFQDNKISNLTLPDNIESIDSRAFKYNAPLKEIMLPNHTTYSYFSKFSNENSFDEQVIIKRKNGLVDNNNR